MRFQSVQNVYQSQNAKRASSQKRHMVISIFLLCNSLILMSIGAGSIRAIKGGLDKVFKIWDRHHRIHRQILGGVQQQKRQRTSCDFPGGMIFFVLFCPLFEDILLTKSGKNNKKEHKRSKNTKIMIFFVLF